MNISFTSFLFASKEFSINEYFCIHFQMATWLLFMIGSRACDAFLKLKLEK